MKAAIGKQQLLAMVPLSWSTINALEKAGEFPKRFAITESRVAWNSDEVEVWLDSRQETGTGKQPINMPDVRQRKTRPVSK
ncbi:MULTISPECIES: helix-turn-helix transcriptional regulator [Serratia]|jgi:Predicted transcriptional regulator|uniref:Predicted transcriptional regulator n=1 Tax=Serratia quinivorans TaxID=137545 RepID=A0A379YT70_9GAMM|nr:MULTISPECIES: AlpA family phage regulatory protein [Serratia]QBX66580.1 AlpA family phage regulatory protein [Serratia quinivorans]RYM60953.1 transcriptional regulator [Serratia proteamaculans]CAI1756190.1 Predicted transcriptional regulator [Serratia quinivorans]SUI49916.1 Predicted transcriptional regulator [Serratia quinivorans]